MKPEVQNVPIDSAGQHKFTVMLKANLWQRIRFWRPLTFTVTIRGVLGAVSVKAGNGKVRE